MTRQRVRPSLKRSVFHDCPACHGTGVVKTPETMSIEVIRMLLLPAQRPDICRVTVTVAEDVAEFVNNQKRRELTRLEDQGAMVVQVIGAKGRVAREPADRVQRLRRPRRAVPGDVRR